MRPSSSILAVLPLAAALLAGAPATAAGPSTASRHAAPRHAATEGAPGPTALAPGWITFGAPVHGRSRDGLRTIEDPTVRFVDTLGANLRVDDYGNQSDGPGLGVFHDDASELVVLFDVPVDRFSLAFGNDDPGFSRPGDRARLVLSRNGHRVATRTVELDRDDLLDQRIGLTSAVPFDKARFGYVRDGHPIDLTEVVDDLHLHHACTIDGTGHDDQLAGIAGSEGLCGRDGDDRLSGNGDDDVLMGGRGRDRLRGGDGDDLLLGGPDADRLHAADGVGGNDIAYGGAGADVCILDRGDRAVGCERVIRR